MKKQISWTMAVLVLSLSGAGCNKSGKLSEPSTFKPPAGAVTFKWKWPKGERIVEDLDVMVDNELTVGMQPNPVPQLTMFGEQFGLTVLQESPDGGHEVEMEILSARIWGTLSGKTNINYDSTKALTQGMHSPVSDVLTNIVGGKVQYFLDASNNVLRIEGVEALANRIPTGGQGDPLGTLKAMYSESFFRQLMDHNKYLPAKPVQIGDTWPVNQEIPMAALGNLHLDVDITFKGWEMHGTRNCARWDFQGSIKSTPDEKAAAAGMKISNFEGDASGTTWFDPELGLAIDTSMNEQMQMLIEVAAAKQSISNQIMEMTSLKLASVK